MSDPIKASVLVPVPIKELETLEFTGTRLPDGNLRAFDTTSVYEDWPEQIDVGGVIFRLSEKDDKGDDWGTPDDGSPEGSTFSMAWYVPEDE